MTIQGVGAGASAVSVSSGRLSLAGGEDFAKSLNLGQIIKGKVLRHFEGNRYLVNFDGHDKVVDSGVPLTTGELIRGRVVAVGDRVELQRVYNDSEAVETPGDPGLPQAGRGEQWLDDLLARYQLNMSADDKAVLSRIARAVDDPAALGMVGVALGKLGMMPTPELLQSVYALFKRIDVPTAFISQPSTDTAAQSLGASLVTVRQLADTLTKVLGQAARESEPVEQAATDPGFNETDARLAIMPRVVKRIDDEDERAQKERAAWAALNAQSDGAVAHRVGTLPLLIGDRLIEVSVAMFEQRREDSRRSGTPQHRQLVFALHTDRLGAVNVSARVTGEHVSVRIVAENESGAQEIAAYSNELRQALAQTGWQVDEITHEADSATENNPAVASVVEHIALQDSLNRLI